MTNLSEKQIHGEWSRVNKTAWKFDEDQVKSTFKLLELMQGLEDCEIIPIRKEKGINAIAFGFKSVLDDVGKGVEEIAMDSTCTYTCKALCQTHDRNDRENQRTWI
jgi:hypothetical protein